MDKRGMAMETVLKFLVGVVVVVIIISGFMFMYGKLKGQTITFSDWVTEQWGGLKLIKIYALDKEEIICKDLNDDEIDDLKLKDKGKYTECLLQRARFAFNDLQDYEDAKVWYEKYVDECKELDVDCAYLDEANDRIKEIPDLIARRAAAKIEYQEATSSGMDIEKLEIFVEEHKDDEDNQIETQVLLSEQFLEKIENVVETGEIESKTEEEIISMSDIQLVNYLKDIDSKRESINAYVVLQKLPFIMESTHSEQIKAEAFFLSLVLEMEDGVDDSNCDVALPYIRDINEKYSHLDFKYLTYSSAHFASREEIIDDPIEKISPTWTSSAILRESRLVRAWCFFREGDYVRSFGIANSLENVDSVKNSEGTRFSESSRYKLLRNSVFKLITPLSNLFKCRQAETESACHNLGGVFKIQIDEKITNVNLDSDVISKEDKLMNPNIGCYFNYDWFDNCQPCKPSGGIGTGPESPLIGGCSGYKTRDLFENMWEWVCRLDPCGISPTGCKVDYKGNDECVPA